MFKNFCTLIFFLLTFNSFPQDYHSDLLNIKTVEELEFSISYTKIDGIEITLTGIEQIDALNIEYRCTEITRRFPEEDQLGLKYWYTFKFDKAESIEEIKSSYEAISEFQFVEFYPIPQTSLLPNDPLLTPEQCKAYWDMKLPDAWNVQTGNSGVIVALIDMGLFWEHPDISINNIYQNITNGSSGYGEDYNQNGVTIVINNGQIMYDPGDINGIDDDGNGKVDDLAGWNFVENNNNIRPNSFTDNHGLAIFGIIAATGNNNEGAAGVAFNSRVLHLKAGYNSGVYGDWIGAIYYALQQGAKIINMSFFNAGYSQMVQNLIDANSQNCFFVACGGFTTQPINDPCPINAYTYPACYDNVIVASVLEHDGIHMRNSTRVSNKIDVLGSQDLRFPWWNDSTQNFDYGYFVHSSGTTAMTSGLLALMISHYPTWSNDKIINQIFATCSSRDDQNRADDNSCNFDFYGLIGHGILDCYKALTFNGNITEDLFWNKELNIYHNINVNSGVTLTIRENSKLNFMNNKTFVVNGTLRILGDLEINTNIQMNPGSNLIIEPGAVVTFTGNTTISGGTLSASTGWFGNYTITGNLNVPSGLTLKVYPQSKVMIQNNSSITSYGNLQLSGCMLGDGIDPWGSLIFDGESANNSYINLTLIKKCNEIRCLNGADILIEASTLDYCSQGIYIYNSQPNIISNQILDPYGNGIYGQANGKTPLIQNNVIKKLTRNLHNYQGIYLQNNTNPFITGNDIQGFLYGIYFGGGGSGFFTDSDLNTPNKNNLFLGNLVGCCVAWGSWMFGGQDGGDYAGFNSFSGDPMVWDAQAYQQGQYIADWNWWGEDGPHINYWSGGYVYINYELDYDPWEGLMRYTTTTEILIDSKSDYATLHTGLSYEKNLRITEAINHYKNMIRDDVYSRFAFYRLSGILKKYDRLDIKIYFEQLGAVNHPYRSTIYNILAGIYLDENRYNDAMSLYNRVIELNSITFDGIAARFEKFYATLHLIKNVQLAEQYLSEIEQLGLTGDDYLMMLSTAQNQLSNNCSEKKILYKNTSRMEISSYSLYQNFPNPFNPSTTIQYNIKSAGRVQLKLFDILGNEITTLVDQFKDPGSYICNFKADNLSSGVYVYKITVNDFVQSKKMTIIK